MIHTRTEALTSLRSKLFAAGYILPRSITRHMGPMDKFNLLYPGVQLLHNALIGKHHSMSDPDKKPHMTMTYDPDKGLGFDAPSAQPEQVAAQNPDKPYDPELEDLRRIQSEEAERRERIKDMPDQEAADAVYAACEALTKAMREARQKGLTVDIELYGHGPTGEQTFTPRMDVFRTTRLDPPPRRW